MNNVYGHEKAKKVLKAVIKRSRLRHHLKCVEGSKDYPKPLNCLLIGESGTGKTFLVQNLQKQYKFPFLSIDATTLMPTGNDSGLNSKQLKKLIHTTAEECLKSPLFHSVEGVMSQMIVFVDEFDKLGTSFDSTGNWNKHTQSNFLTLMEHGGMFNGISWVLAGAFTSIPRETAKRGIGFFPQAQEATNEITDDDIIKAGIIPEMLGRISLVVELDRFTEQDYKNILREELLPQYKGVVLDEEQVINKAQSSGLGVRSLIRQLEMASIEQEVENASLAK